MIDLGDVDLKALDAEARTALRGGNVDRGLELFERLWQVAWERRSEEDARFYLQAECRSLAEYFLTHGRPSDARVWVERYHQVLGTDRPMSPQSAIYDIALAYESGDLKGAYERAKGIYDMYGPDAFNGKSWSKKYGDWFLDFSGYGSLHVQIPAADLGSDSELPDELPDEPYDQIVVLWDRIEELFDEKSYAKVIPLAIEGLNLLPQPLSHWELATQLYILLGESCYREGYLREAERAVREAFKCPGGLENQMAWCVLGMTLKDQEGREAQALDALMSAYMIDGADIFEGLGFDSGLDLLRNKGLI